jgi:23S rRNA pseudouridine2605 synthase
MRINAYLRTSGFGSRRSVETLILKGRVRVNGKKVDNLATLVNLQDVIEVDQKRVFLNMEKHYFIYHKPPKVLVTRNDPLERSTIFNQLPSTKPFKSVQPVGRLDYASEGLLLLTNDGALANSLLHPRYGHFKVYRILVTSILSDQHKKRLEAGLQLDDGFVRFKRVRFLKQQDLGAQRLGQWLELTISIGRKRVVRRSLELLDLQVNRLVRIEFANLRLGDLKVGEYRVLLPAEVKSLQKFCIEKKPSSQLNSETAETL